MIDIFDKDKFGFYKVGDYKTYSKIEAIELATKQKLPLTWDFNHKLFSCYDWSKEPSQSLDELYAIRARQIRNSYDYVVLMYSGGIDSGNILETFVKNQITLDEVCTYDYKGGDFTYNRAELEKAAWPKLKEYQDRGVKFFHRHLDYTDLAKKLLQNQNYNFDRVYYHNHHFGVNHLAKTYLRELLPDYVNLIEKGKKIVFVWGIDKPHVTYENSRWIIRFSDISDAGVSPRTQMLNRDYEHDEYFYWSPDAVDLICKQAHVLKRYWELNGLINNQQYDQWRDKYLSKYSVEEILARSNPKQQKNLQEKIIKPSLQANYLNRVNSLIYTNFQETMFSLGKYPFMLISAKEQHINNDSEFSKQHRNFLTHIGQLDSSWLINNTQLLEGIKPCTQNYYLD
jgi:hypothetical protein